MVWQSHRVHEWLWARILVMLLSGIAVLAAAVADSSGLTQDHSADLPEWFKFSFLDLPEDLAEATARGKRLMLFFHQDGCLSCRHYYQDILAAPSIEKTVRARFDVVPIDINGNREVVDLQGNLTYENRFAASLGAAVTPTVIILDSAGGIALKLRGRVTSGEFVQALKTVGE